ncbi:MAG: exonuclease domain-containing protein [bacterium]
MEFLGNVTFAYLDTETTGLSPIYGDRIIEVAVMKARGGQILDAFESLVNPQRPIAPGATAIHGITDKMVAGCPVFRDMAHRLQEYLKGAVMVAHNARFDLSFISYELRRVGYEPPVRSVVDSLALARKHFHFESNSLPNIARSLEIPLGTRHRAMPDVLTLKAVFEILMEGLSRNGVLTLEQLITAQGGPLGIPEEIESVLPPEIDEALMSKKRLHVRYLDADGTETLRWVSPIHLEFLRDNIYLRGYCHLREDERSFRLDRIVELRVE